MQSAGLKIKTIKHKAKAKVMHLRRMSVHRSEPNHHEEIEVSTQQPKTEIDVVETSTPP